VIYYEGDEQADWEDPNDVPDEVPMIDEDDDSASDTSVDDEAVEFDLDPCTRCGKLPKDCTWRCRRCLQLAETIPYPTIGCQCIAAVYTCDSCLWKSGL
jgi:hypothetical protein